MVKSGQAENVFDLRGLSTDTKPSSADPSPVGKPIGNGSTFFEIDTGKCFMYDEESDQWDEL